VAKSLTILEWFQEKQGRSEAEQKTYEDHHRDKRINWTAAHVDQKLRQQHQRDKGEE